MAGLSDAELSALEDELDFCGFTGVPTPRILDILKDLGALDRAWADLLHKGVDPDVPEAF